MLHHWMSLFFSSLQPPSLPPQLPLISRCQNFRGSFVRSSILFFKLYSPLGGRLSLSLELELLYHREF